MSSVLLQLTPEETLLFLTCRPYLSHADDQQIRRLATRDRDWEHIVWRSELHRTLPLLRYHLDRLRCHAEVPEDIWGYLSTWSRLSALRSELQLEELTTLIQAFNEADIEFCLLKGTAIASVLLSTPSIRPMLDLDLLVNPGHITQARAVMQELGYVHAEWNPDTDEMTLVSEDAVASATEQHYELPAYMKRVIRPSPVPAQLVLPAWRHKHLKCLIDEQQNARFALFVDLHLNVSFDFDLQDVWADVKREVVQGQPVLVHAYTAMIWFLASRLYHEVFQFNEVKLTMFGDLHTVLHERGDQIDWAQILAIAHKYGLQPSLYYVLGHLRSATGAAVPEDLLAELGSRSAASMHDWGDPMLRIFGREPRLELRPA